MMLSEFLAARGLSEPDERPLYAYRCNADEFRELESYLTERLAPTPDFAGRVGAAPLSMIGPVTSRILCLWAAEWWRRNHEGGAWKWEPLLAAIYCEHMAPGGPGYTRLCEGVAEGLRGWKREILRTGHGRAFLITLACEGGLPLQLLKREGASLRKYFRVLLEEIGDRSNSEVPAEQTAERLAGYLPRSLHHDVVFQLSGRLIARVWKLQMLVGPTSAPVRDLDRLRPGWRDELPLNVEDSVARALLNNLVTDASTIARMGATRLAWRRFLVPVGDDWDLMAEMELPVTLRKGDFIALFNPDGAETPRRFDLGVRIDGGRTEVLALGTERTNGGTEPLLHLDHTRSLLQTVRGPAARAGRLLVARDGRHQYETNQFSGAPSLSDLPWIFSAPAENNASGEFRLLAEGSIRVKEESVLVATPVGGSLQEQVGAQVQLLGRINGLDRLVYQVFGDAAYQLPDGGSVVIRTRNSAPSASHEYRLRGSQATLSRDIEPVFIGMPHVVELADNAASVTIPQNKLQWKSDRPFNGWIPYSAHCLGAGRIRYVEGGEVRFSSHVQILPDGAEVHYYPEHDSRRGVIELRSVRAYDLTDISLEDSSDIQLECRPGRCVEDLKLLLSTPTEPPGTVTLRLNWTDHRRLVLSLPFPSCGAGFHAPHGQILPHEAITASGSLSGVRAVAMVPHHGQSFEVEGRYQGDDAVETGANRMWLRLPMKEVVGGRYELDLGVAHSWIISRLNASNDPEGYVRLQVHSNAVANLACRSLDVSRYDITLRLDRDAGVVRLPAESLQRLTAEEVEDFRLESFPLFSPDRAPIPLERISNVTWLLPEINDCLGPQMIVGWQGDWCRAQPCVVDPSHDAPAAGTLWTMPRRDLVSALSEDTAHPGWTVVDGLLDWTRHLPPVAFDLLRSLAKNPNAMALAALRVPESGFDRFWVRMETLRFAWFLVPQSAWTAAVETFVRSLENQLSTLGSAAEALDPKTLVVDELDRAVRRVTSRLPCIEPSLGRSRARVLGLRLSGQENAILHEPIRDMLLHDREQLFTRSGVTTGDLRGVPGIDGLKELISRFPRLPELDRLWITRGLGPGDKRFEIANAPVVSALASISGVKLTKLQTFQLLGIREVAPGWFDDSHRACYLYALGVVLSSRVQEAL